MSKLVIHKSTAWKQDNLRYHRIIWCSPNTHFHPLSLQESRYWKKVTCKRCLKKKNKRMMSN